MTQLFIKPVINMLRIIPLSLIAALLLFNQAQASNIEEGKKLYHANCDGCHDTRVHTRPNRIIHTYEDLIGRVKFCDAASKAGFNDTQLMNVVDYLNVTYYKFVKSDDTGGTK